MLIEPQRDYYNVVECNHGDLGSMEEIAPTTTGNQAGADPKKTALKHFLVSPDDSIIRKVVDHKRFKSPMKVSFDLRLVEPGEPVGSERFHLSEEQRKDLWIGNETKREAKVVVNRIKRSLAEDKLSPSNHSSYLMNCEQAFKFTHDDETLASLVRSLAIDSSARGLEPYILPHMNEARRRYVKMLLRAQSRLPLEANAEQNTFLLREVSKRLTKPSRRFAQILGIGDAKVVADMLLADTCV